MKPKIAYLIDRNPDNWAGSYRDWSFYPEEHADIKGLPPIRFKRIVYWEIEE